MKHIILGFTALLFIGCNSNTESSTENNPIVEAPVNKISQAWYMKTIAKATLDDTVYIHDTAGVFGELKESEEKKDHHDILGFGTAILQVVFPKTTWEENNGDYFSDYRALTAEGEKVSWIFQVKNQRDIDLANASLDLSLEGPYELTPTQKNGLTIYKESFLNDESKKLSMTLIDIDNQKRYSYQELKDAALGMDGLHTRTFRWVVGDVSSEDYAPLPEVENTDTLSGKQVAPSFKISNGIKANSKFGLPPQ